MQNARHSCNLRGILVSTVCQRYPANTSAALKPSRAQVNIECRQVGSPPGTGHVAELGCVILCMFCDDSQLRPHGCLELQCMASWLPYSTLSANSAKYMFTFEPVKTVKNSPQYISEGSRIWQVCGMAWRGVAWHGMAWRGRAGAGAGAGAGTGTGAGARAGALAHRYITPSACCETRPR